MIDKDILDLELVYCGQWGESAGEGLWLLALVTGER